jgi:hypothetical protein
VERRIISVLGQEIDQMWASIVVITLSIPINFQWKLEHRTKIVPYGNLVCGGAILFSSLIIYSITSRKNYQKLGHVQCWVYDLHGTWHHIVRSWTRFWILSHIQSILSKAWWIQTMKQNGVGAKLSSFSSVMIISSKTRRKEALIMSLSPFY